MTEIDSTTNLPKLPENFFWRVARGEDREYGSFGWTYRSESNKLRLIENTTEKVTEGRLWWKKTTTKPIEKVHYDLVIQKTLPVAKGKGTRALPAPKGYALSDNGEYYVNKALNRETILDTAERILSKQARDDIVKAEKYAEGKLYGDYPPKSLL
jgi:hypothetical protein